MDYYYSPVWRGTTDRYPPTWSDGILIILRRLLLGPSLGELHYIDPPSYDNGDLRTADRRQFAVQPADRLFLVPAGGPTVNPTADDLPAT